MDDIKDYLISICTAAILCGIITKLTAQKGSGAALIKVLCGIYMLITFLSPVISLPLIPLQTYFDQLVYEAERVADAGEQSAIEETEKIIQQRSEAYIREKATAMGTDLNVEVTIRDGIPHSVHISGAVSPYVKQKLSQLISSDLGIALEEQQWNI